MNIERFRDSSDGTIKTVNKTEKGVIEMSLLFNKNDIDVVCVPTHYYCNLGCKMCHLTKEGFNKPMIKINIKEFLFTLVKSVNNNLDFRRTNKEKLLISFMGVGEPLLNLKLIEDVIKSEKYLKERLGYKNIGYAISTMMPNNNILQLIEISNKYNASIKVHFSMHNPIDIKRKELIPNTGVDVKEALEYLIKYKNAIKTNDFIIKNHLKFHRTSDLVEIHYTLIEDENDGEKELNTIIELLKSNKITVKFLTFNKKDNLNISKREEMWIETIKNSIPNIRIKKYSPPGKEVGSSCGQFTKYYYLTDIEDKASFDKWKNAYQIFN